MSNLTRNITRTFRAADESHVRTGLAWYRNANAAAFAMSVETGISVEQAAGIIAALSPMLSWDRNVQAAFDVARTGTAHAVLKQNLAKAVAIREGADPAKMLGGQKVTAFYRNILSAGQDDGVTVDRHAIDVALGIKHSDATRPAMGKRAYAEIADAYRRAARILSRERGVTITPAQIQAVTWCAWRADHAWRRA